MHSNDLIILANKVGIPVQKLSAKTITAIKDAPHAQLRTANYKKAVYIVDNLVFKGPYTCTDPRLMNNLRHIYAVQLLEEKLHLLEWQKGALSWKFIGQWGIDQYYLVAPNVGKTENIPFEIVSSKIEKDVPIVPRGGVVWRVSDVEKNGRLTNGIKQAALQHLYFRFLLDIGDSGTHNILIQDNNDTMGRLIAGIDLEEKRAIKEKKHQLNHLFKKKPSKRQVNLYQSNVSKIKPLSYGQLNQHTIDSLQAVGIDLKRLKVNMARWSRLY